ncbi:reverse transcriptase N-terminal domain-containing protein [Rodentibacter genomosp. 2]|uniref:reverse transcriptase N-terminal domain-containing protein n=1 Tax=Rodentibacter genomosp. 2 TaxID=1908266 RepID=UPI001FC9B84F
MKEQTHHTKKLVSSLAPATSHISQWHYINWYKANRYVKGMQVRIAKATQESNWRKVKNLQRMLTHSFYAKALAVRRVTENTGKRLVLINGFGIHLNPNGLLYKIYQVKGINLNH